ncbi:MAG TPA: hypothetical protein PLP73_00345 [Candidatus Absconditabacterales bacterium]|nr:hypothetical protein [Candidatus Absconditabacterales bacterium]HRU50010.1 hypothetical protein [Candidatus Absconditabacterales bacterium]
MENGVLRKKEIIEKANNGGCSFGKKIEIVQLANKKTKLKFYLNRNIKAFLDGLIMSGVYYFDGTVLKKKDEYVIKSDNTDNVEIENFLNS